MVDSKVRNDDALGWRLKLGVIVPATNTIVEPEFHSMTPAGVTCHTGRFPLKDVRISSNDDFERLVADIHANLDRAVDDLMSVDPDHIIVGVSAESFWDGADGAEVIRNRLAEKTGVSVTLGSDAARVALEAVAAQRIGVLTPYWPVADERVRQYFNQCGFTAVRVTGLKATSPLNIAEQSRDTLRQAILDLDGDDIDTIVQVGTNLALAALADELEQELGKPVIAINVALYWHALRQNGINEPIPGFGRLLKNL
ncbi:MAG TPA: aspartate/glutamate racemase family protein [Arenicellales bacterium]|jgi:maleate isomerase|nr:aspartate/glutamate racemase family protein [Arenicellales bacterium]